MRDSPHWGYIQYDGLYECDERTLNLFLQSNLILVGLCGAVGRSIPDIAVLAIRPHVTYYLFVQMRVPGGGTSVNAFARILARLALRARSGRLLLPRLRLM